MEVLDGMIAIRTALVITCFDISRGQIFIQAQAQAIQVGNLLSRRVGVGGYQIGMGILEKVRQMFISFSPVNPIE